MKGKVLLNIWGGALLPKTVFLFRYLHIRRRLVPQNLIKIHSVVHHGPWLLVGSVERRAPMLPVQEAFEWWPCGYLCACGCVCVLGFSVCVFLRRKSASTC